jgi:hypothetical protein
MKGGVAIGTYRKNHRNISRIPYRSHGDLYRGTPDEGPMLPHCVIER